MIYLLTKKKVLFKDGDINYSTKISEVISDLKEQKVIALDIETNGFDTLTNKVLMLQLGTREGNQYVIDSRDYDISKFKEILEDSSKVFVGHNIKFDYNSLKKHNIVLSRVYDTMLSDIVIYNGYYSKDYIKKNKRFSLAGVYKHHFNKAIEKETRDTFKTIGSTPFSYSQVLYGANDVKYPLEIMKVQRNLLNEFDLVECAKLENKVTLALADIEYNGFYLNRDKWGKVAKEYSRKVKETTDKLDRILISKDKSYKKKYYQKDLFDEQYEDKRFTVVNWDSPQQVYEILTNVFDIYLVDKHGKPSTSTKAIEYLTSTHEITDKLLQYRQESKALNAFGENFARDSTDKEGRIHTKFTQIVETGRVSSSKPNLQQIPSSKLFRECFEAPKGRKIITADYSTQEGRIMADQSKDEAYVDFFKNGGGDAHSFVATKMFSAKFGKEFIVTKYNENKEYRQQGKKLNFSISYGGTAFSLSKSLKISVEEAQELINAFFRGFKQLKEYFDTNSRFGLNNGYIRTNTITKRRRWFQEYEDYLVYKERANQSDRSLDYYKRYKTLEGSIGRKSQNTPVQGTAGDMTKQALVYIRDKLLENGVKPLSSAEAKLVSVVHDECSLEVVEGKAEFYAKIQREAMEKAANLLTEDLDIPVDQEIGDHWSH